MPTQPVPGAQHSVQMTGKCTTCHKSFVLTEAMMGEVADVGVPFSPCCNAVGYIVKVKVKTKG
jgi:hypothetical protein